MYDKHKTYMFKTELKALLCKYGVVFNPEDGDCPAEFRQADDGGVWLELDREFADVTRRMQESYA